MKVAVYPGTFDPVTLGHVNIVKRGLSVFDRVVVACNEASVNKKTLFTLDERFKMLKRVFENENRLDLDTFDGLLVNYLESKDCYTILRGIRTVEDFEYEYRMGLANKMLNNKVETVFMLTDGAYGHLSSSLIKEIASMRGNIEKMVPKEIIDILQSKFSDVQHRGASC